MKTPEERHVELIEKLGEVLEEGEIAFVLQKEGRGVYAFPNDTEAKAAMAKLSLTESFNVVSQAAQFLGLALVHHKKNVADEGGQSFIVQPQGPRIIKPH